MNGKLKILLTTSLLLFSFGLFAQETETPAPETTTTTAPESQDAPAPEQPELRSSYDIRTELHQILRRSPPALTTVLQLDPTLLSNPDYLSTYPQLGAFLEQHPEIRHDPKFYLGDPTPPRPESLLGEVVESLAIMATFLIVALAIVWLIRTIIEQRRWSRLSRTQSEVHNKILDRFTTNEELIAYVGTPAGRKFLESAPINVQSQAPKNLPVTRILWSVQLGVVIVAGAIGLSVVSGLGFAAEESQSLLAMGVIAACLGAGFIGSGFLSLYLSRRLGLWESTEPSPASSELL
ncbi:MAG: hypothetical protein KY459_14995 [Acidobacteria bacterium]|nr:hypothetical protein [Acidobacteriota bacterium]